MNENVLDPQEVMEQAFSAADATMRVVTRYAELVQQENLFALKQLEAEKHGFVDEAKLYASRIEDMKSAREALVEAFNDSFDELFMRYELCRQ